MSTFIGIDLGTTYSALSIIDESGRPVIVPNRDGENITASCVDERAGAMRVGAQARATWGVAGGNDGGRAAARFKRDMGTDTQFQINEHQLSASELSAMILRKLALDAGDGGLEVREAVVTIPANFPTAAREATMEAARSAGLEVKHIINEPTAAALYYAFRHGEALQGNYAVYDLGGGTFDISIIRMSGQKMDVLASNGIAKLGGYDFDHILRNIVAEKYEEQAGSKMGDADFTLNDAEEMKIRLSEREKDDADIGRGAAGELIAVSRQELEKAVQPLVRRAEMLCDAALKEANIIPDELRGVLLVGGSTRMPLVRESVKRVFRQEPEADENVDEVVALGAALYALYKSDRSSLSAAQKTAVDKMLISESASKCFGTIALTYSPIDEASKVNDILIPKGSTIPCSVTRSYQTIRQGQRTICCRVTESTEPQTDPAQVTVLKEVDLLLPPGRPSRQEIRVTFSYDENQIMQCSFLDVSSGKEHEMALSLISMRDDRPFDIYRYMVE